jgi:hypothetical protein
MDRHEVAILVPSKKTVETIDISSSSEGDGAAARAQVKHEEADDAAAKDCAGEREEDDAPAPANVQLTRRGKIYYGAY